MNTTNTAAFGDLTSLNEAGSYEYNTISAVNGNSITFENGLQHAFDVSGAVQIVSIPNYDSQVKVSATLTAQAWDGTKGGVLIFNTTGDVILYSDIDVSGQGFRGGFNDISLPRLNNTTEFYYLVIYLSFLFLVQKETH